MRKNTFTVRVSSLDGQRKEIVRNATTIFSNLGGFLINTTDSGSHQFDGDRMIVILGSDDWDDECTKTFGGESK